MSNQVEYDDIYIETCFRAWYDAGCPKLRTGNGTVPVGGKQVMKVFPPAPDGRKPTFMTIRNWMERFDWQARADALDAEVSVRLDREAIEKRVSVLRDLADTGKTLMDKGVEYILKNDNPFQDNPSAAVRAIISGAEMQFKFASQADKLAIIANMSDKQIEKEILRLLGKPNNDDETVDAELEDIPSDTEPDDNS